MQIFEQLKECRSIKSIAVQNNMSPPTAARIINEIDFKTGKLPQVLAIDEFRGNAEGEKFQCILADPENRRIVDILPNRKHDMIRHYLLKYNNRKAVKFVVMDMTGGYRKLMHELFPQAKIIVDKYHYVRQITYALERVRVEEQKKYSEQWRRYFKVSFTYQNWSKEILNSFEYPYTNGYIEGCNNRIKVLKRISFGMPRFVRFRRRIMHIMLN